MIVNYPVTTMLLAEARLYASDSIQHTMDYHGFRGGDLDKKRERITVGNFCQLWVCEFCRLNGVSYSKDASSPDRPDDYDLIAHGYRIDVKSSIDARLIGQVSSGVINKPVDYFCFMLTDRQCTFIAPYGLIEAVEYRNIAVEVNEGDMIPGTTLRQRFGKSYFLPKNAELLPFVQFFLNQGRVKSRVIQPTTIVDGRSIENIEHQLATSNQLLLEVIRSLSTRKTRGNVTTLPVTNDLLKDAGIA